ncbi:MAG TPA: type II toxin-antitoxin system VapB family antitoxin [Rhizomicrobium sp.]
MATNISINSKLLKLALEVSGERTENAVVAKALQEFIGFRRQRLLLKLVSKLEWNSAFDHKSERGRG